MFSNSLYFRAFLYFIFRPLRLIPSRLEAPVSDPVPSPSNAQILVTIGSLLIIVPIVIVGLPLWTGNDSWGLAIFAVLIFYIMSYGSVALSILQYIPQAAHTHELKQLESFSLLMLKMQVLLSFLTAGVLFVLFGGSSIHLGEQEFLRGCAQAILLVICIRCKAPQNQHTQEAHSNEDEVVDEETELLRDDTRDA